jgi:hypothetical protein
LVAYFVGNFQSKNATTPNFAAQFQVKVNANLERKRIYVHADQWAKEYSNSSDFELNVYYAGIDQW